jgi:hypothetical protein
MEDAMTVEQQRGYAGDARVTPRLAGDGVPVAGELVGQQAVTASEASRGLATMALMEKISERSNLNLAYERVVSNGGAPGVDGMTVDALKP